MLLKPIGAFYCAASQPYDAARQPAVSEQGSGYVLLDKGHNYEQALQDLAGFSHIWLVYLFHHNTHWKPLVQPPRADRKVGVFASRAPYRPNPIGMSCVTLLRVKDLRLEVGPHDLLDGTPILDIKPYLPYADSFPEAACGWIESLQPDSWQVVIAPAAEEQLGWLAQHGVASLRAFLQQQLVERPFDEARKRIRPLGGQHWVIAYRTWRVQYEAAHSNRIITVERVSSGYTAAELDEMADPHADKALHRNFAALYPGPSPRGP